MVPFSWTLITKLTSPAARPRTIWLSRCVLSLSRLSPSRGACSLASRSLFRTALPISQDQLYENAKKIDEEREQLHADALQRWEEEHGAAWRAARDAAKAREAEAAKAREAGKAHEAGAAREAMNAMFNARPPHPPTLHRSAPSECAICHEPVGTKGLRTTLSGCSHAFCEGCIKSAVAPPTLPRCPTCRETVESITNPLGQKVKPSDLPVAQAADDPLASGGGQHPRRAARPQEQQPQEQQPQPQERAVAEQQRLLNDAARVQRAAQRAARQAQRQAADQPAQPQPEAAAPAALLAPPAPPSNAPPPPAPAVAQQQVAQQPAADQPAQQQPEAAPSALLAPPAPPPPAPLPPAPPPPPPPAAGPSSASHDKRPHTTEALLKAIAERDLCALRGAECESGLATPAITALKAAAGARGLALPTAVGKRKRGQPLPDGYVVVRASEDVVPQGTLPACVHLVTMLTRAATMHDPLAVVPFKVGASMALMTEAALVMRRAVASSLTLQKITDLRRAIEPGESDLRGV